LQLEGFIDGTTLLLPLLLLLLLLLLLSRLLTFTKDFFESPDFGEQQVAGGATFASISSPIDGPEGIDNDIIGGGLERFEVELVGEVGGEFGSRLFGWRG
jgi:hypothetical protein